jgi:hypothetical protein
MLEYTIYEGTDSYDILFATFRDAFREIPGFILRLREEKPVATETEYISLKEAFLWEKQPDTQSLAIHEKTEKKFFWLDFP